MDFPLKISDVLKLGKSFISAQKQGIRLGIYIDPRCPDELVNEVCTLFSPQGARAKVFVEILSGDPAADRALIVGRNSYNTIVLVCAQSDQAAELLPLPKPDCVIIADELRSTAAEKLGRSILEVLSPRSGDLDSQLGTWFSTQVPAKRLQVAADFPFTRGPISHEVRTATAWQNGVIALVPFTRGADMPVLVANQMKMILQLAMISGLKPGLQQAPELLATGLAALAGRRLATRSPLRLAPARWLTQALISFSVTWVLGLAAERSYALRGPQT